MRAQGSRDVSEEGRLSHGCPWSWSGSSTSVAEELCATNRSENRRLLAGLLPPMRHQTGMSIWRRLSSLSSCSEFALSSAGIDKALVRSSCPKGARHKGSGT